MKRFFASWSGGKDSCFAAMKAIAAGYHPAVLLNMMNENGKVSRSHAIPKAVLEKQSHLAGIPVETRSASWNEYERIFIETLHELKQKYQVSHGVFGDIDLQDHRDWEEKVCNAAEIIPYLPLWQNNRKALVFDMISSGIVAHIVSCNEAMGEEFLGEKITPGLIERLEQIGVDACGENGEYHTLVVDCPLFKNKMNVEFGNAMHHNRYWFIEMNLV